MIGRHGVRADEICGDYKGEEEVLGKAYDARLMKRLLKYVKPYKKYVLFAITLILLSCIYNLPDFEILACYDSIKQLELNVYFCMLL